MKYEIKTVLLPTGTKRRSGKKMNKIIFCVAHDTGNINSTAMNNVNYYINSANEESASAHQFVDDKEIITCIPIYNNTEKAWHVLYNKPKDNELFGGDANNIACSVELCYFTDKNRTLEAYKKYVWLLAYNAWYFNYNPKTHIVGHSKLDPERKTDPENALKTIGKTFDNLINDVVAEYNECLKGDSMEHWAEKHYQELIEKGFKIHEKRFEDNITRGEAFALLNQVTDVVINNIIKKLKEE